mgnify:CR=1 FL=1
MSEKKAKDEIDENNKEEHQINMESTSKEEEKNKDTTEKKIPREPNEEKKATSKNTSSNQLPEFDDRAITSDIIELLKTDLYKKYKTGENQLRKLKIKNEENFLENKLLINVADLLGVKKISFENITTNNFNSLLTQNSLLVKKYQKMNSEMKKAKEAEKTSEEKNETKDEINLEEIVVKNCQIDNKLEINYSSIFPIIKKLTIKNSKLPYDISTNLNFNFMTHLILENIGLIDDNFNSIFMQIRSNRLLKNNLKYISFKNNNIGLFEPSKGIDQNKLEEELGLNNLEVLDLSNNRIFFMSIQMINALKKIKLIDFTNNGIIFPSRYSSYLSAGKKVLFLILLTKNYALLNSHNKEEYINYLFEVIPKINYGFNSISLINLYSGKFYEKMKTLNLSKFSETLVDLDISYGNINDKDLTILLKGNLALPNLKNLNLAKNKLTDNLLDILLEGNYQEKFSKLKSLNLSSNQIVFKKAERYQNFFEKFKSLKLFEIKQTAFELSLNNYTRTIINRYYENERYKMYKTNFSNEDLEIQKIMENNKYLVNKTNVTICVYDTNNHKYIAKIKKFYPEMLERINFETRFIESK